MISGQNSIKSLKKTSGFPETENRKVLIVYPGKNVAGGVTELYNIVGFQSDNINYFELYGSLRNKFDILDTLFMYIRFVTSVNKYSIVHLNPSLDKKAFVRDAALILLSRLFYKKILVYWHGWIDEFEDKIKSRFIYSFLFKCSFKKPMPVSFWDLFLRISLDLWVIKILFI